MYGVRGKKAASSRRTPKWKESGVEPPHSKMVDLHSDELILRLSFAMGIPVRIVLEIALG
jgi:hypothetical protein